VCFYLTFILDGKISRQNECNTPLSIRRNHLRSVSLIADFDYRSLETNICDQKKNERKI
jgi:hypothetical protein